MIDSLNKRMKEKVKHKQEKYQLSEQDRIDFANEVKNITKLSQDKHFFSPKNYNKTKKNNFSQNSPKNVAVKNSNILFYFSDEYEAILNENPLSFLNENYAKHLLKALQKGHFEPEIFLDLHGLTKRKAKQELSQILSFCEQEKIICISIMTGYGSYILKNALPHWLVQYPKLIALSQAPKEYGGNAAILVLIDNDFNKSDFL